MEKHSSFIFHTTSPVNGEPPLNRISGNYITRNEFFYIRNHGDIPDVDIQSFRLVVNGLVDNELELSLEMLLKNFAKHKIMATLQCAGNRRDELIAKAEIPGEVPWKAAAIGNATWAGVRLKDILMFAGVKTQAKFVEFMGMDEVFRHHKNVGYGASIPIEKALSDEVLLSYEMNGSPLEPTHGFPLRVVVPGYIGARSVKWLNRISLLASPSKNYFQDHAYRLFPPQAKAETVVWNSGMQLSEQAVNCVITSPLQDESCKNDILVRGYAVSGSGRTISRVDVSTDGGTTWSTAQLDKGDETWAWTFWSCRINVPKGTYQIIARAFNTAANTQPEKIEHIWNFKGYMNNAWHRVSVNVDATE